jgi:hypothetical protein
VCEGEKARELSIFRVCAFCVLRDIQAILLCKIFDYLASDSPKSFMVARQHMNQREHGKTSAQNKSSFKIGDEQNYSWRVLFVSRGIVT